MSKSLTEQYLTLIDEIVNKTLQGKIASTERVYIMLERNVDPGMGEIFERCLNQKIEKTKTQLDKKLKASRILRALETIETQWKRLEKSDRENNAIASYQKKLITVESQDRISTFIEIIDPNQKQPITQEQLQQLAKICLKVDNVSDRELIEFCTSLSKGITTGLQSFREIESDLISWMYESGNNLGFARETPNPWRLWCKKVNSPLPQQLFKTLAESRSIWELGGITNNIELTGWVELAVLLQYVQKGLVTWYDKQPYDAKFGKQLSYSTFLTFAVIWLELFQTVNSNNIFKDGCFQIMLQIMRTFAKRDDFPFYSGVFVSFSGDFLQNTLEYFSEPLQQTPGTQEKARILTLLGYSQRTLGQYDRANKFHQEALIIATEAEDRICQIANLNHLSRTRVQQKNYDEAINYSQRALILARQIGSSLGEANALVNLGYSKVFLARQLDTMDENVYNEAISYLQQGITKAEKAEDIQSQSLGKNSLGIAYVILSQPTNAIKALLKGAKLAQISRDVYLQGLSFTYLAEAYYSIEDRSQSVFYGCLAMYLLQQINSLEWRKVAGLVLIIQGQIGSSEFNKTLSQYRSEIISLIGVDGYDYLPDLINEYKNN